MSGDVEQEEKQNSIKAFIDMLDGFLEGRCNDFSLDFERPLKLSENEYYGILGYYDSSGGAGSFDMFSYDIDTIEGSETGKCFRIIKKLVIERDIQEADNGETIYIIYKAEGYTDKIDVDCKDKED